MCLKDEQRTLAFREAIHSTVRPGDVVVEVGAGTGILSFFAAEAGARRVYAVEVDPRLAEAIRQGKELNGFGDRISVVEGDAATVSLPRRADVVIAELIDTGLLDEQQVPVLNRLHRDDVVGGKVIPAGYRTSLQLVSASHRYYGFEIVAPKHEWPFYSEGSGWHSNRVAPATPVHTIAELDFEKGVVEEPVSGSIEFEVDPESVINAVRLAGVVTLCPGLELGPTNAINGDKVIPIPPISGVAAVRLRYAYKMGDGLAGLKLDCAPLDASAPAGERRIPYEAT